MKSGGQVKAAYAILKGHVDGTYPTKPSKPANFAVACAALETAPPSFGRSIRLLIPRMLVPLYDIRNSRSVGHIGGDVNPNYMDALCVLHISKWVVAEFVRLFHGVSIDEAKNIVDSLSTRETALVWDTGSVKRVLSTSLTMLEKTLIILYSNPQPTSEIELVRSTEHSNASIFRRDILKKAHTARLIEYDTVTKLVKISPLGVRRVEEVILPKV